MERVHDEGTSLAEWLGATGALLPVLVGLIAVAATFWRRPKLSLHALPEHSHVERSTGGAPVPFVRLVARNGRWHRASHGTRVLVEYVQPVGGDGVYLGSPPLGWTSATDAVDHSVVIFPDGERTVDLGAFGSYISTDGSDQWCLTLVPYLRIHEGRNTLLSRRDGYVVRLVIGSDDGRARRHDVRVNWNGAKHLVTNEWNVYELLDSVECEVKRARRGTS